MSAGSVSAVPHRRGAVHFSTGLTTRKTARGGPLTSSTAYLVIQSAAFVFELLISHPATPLKSLWLGLLMSGSLLVAPCLWLAFRESIAGARPATRNFRAAIGSPSPRDAVHLAVDVRGASGYHFRQSQGA